MNCWILFSINKFFEFDVNFRSFVLMSSLCSHITISESDSSSCSSSPSSRSSSSFSDVSTSDLSPPSSRLILKASSSAGIQLNVSLGRPNNSASRDDKENLQVVVLKVVQVVTNTRTYQGSRFWVAVAVGDGNCQIGIGEHVGKTETIARKRAERKAFRSIKRIDLFEERTPLKTRVTGWSGGTCLTISSAPRGTGVISTSGMTRKVLQLAGVKDCLVKNAWDKLTTVRVLAEAFSKMSTTNRK